MRKCFLSIMMALALALSLFPASALAAGDPPAGTEEANYVTLELKYGNHVDADIQSAAKAIYEGKTYASGAAANEAYLSLFGVNWEQSADASEGNGKPGYYLHVTDSNAPLYAFMDTPGSVTEVIFTVYGTVPGFTSLQSNGNNIDCTIGGNHQIFRTSYTVRGVNNTDGSKAKITSGNLQAYVAGGYDSSFTKSGTLTIENIEFDTGSYITAGASAAPADDTNKEVTSASMVIKDCVFNDYLYVYDHFLNGDKMTYRIEGNTFNCADADRALFIQSLDSGNYLGYGPSKVEIIGNTITAKTWVLDCNVPKADFIVQGNTITKTEDTRGAAVQFSNGQSLEVSEENIIVSEGNAIWIHNAFKSDESICGTPKLTISGNTIDAKYLICDSGLTSEQTWSSNTITPTTDVTQGRLNNPGGSEPEFQAVTEETAAAIEDTLTNYLTVSGINGFEDRKFPTFGAAYDAVSKAIADIAAGENGGLEQEPAESVEVFDALFTDRDANGDAAITYTIHGTVTYDETNYPNLLSMGRQSSHYSVTDGDGISRHLIRFFFRGAAGRDTDTLVVNSTITLPYEWWGEDKTTVISFDDLTITGSAPNGLSAYQSYYEGLSFAVNDCKLEGIKIYSYGNVDGTITITNNIFEGSGALSEDYAIHLQGSETEPLNISISNNTISGYGRGINIDQATAVAEISGNTISNTDSNRSTIQLTQLDEAAISNNTLQLAGGNAFTLHENLADGSEISITGNTITGNGYLVYDAAANKGNTNMHPNGLDLTVSGNQITGSIDTTQGIYKEKIYPHTDTVDAVINPPPTSSGGSSTRYTVSVPSDVDNGTVTVSPSRASRGSTVTVTVTPDEGYELDTLTVTDSDGNALTLTDKGDGKYTFTMPRGAVSVSASFKAVEEEPQPSAFPFADVAENAWYYDAVVYAWENDLMTGTSATTFAPGVTTSRAMLATLLYRLEGEPVVNYAMSFTDVAEGLWYSKAVRWAASEGVVNGVGDGSSFAPTGAITREQMAAMLYRYAQYKGYDVTGSAGLSGYADADSVSSWAEYAVAWAVDAGLISGVGNNTLNPQGSATRAEIATILMRFVEGFVPAE